VRTGERRKKSGTDVWIGMLDMGGKEMYGLGELRDGVGANGWGEGGTGDAGGFLWDE
jgi:hypothetical protein